MDALFDRIVADALERPLPPLTRRDVRLPGLPGKVDAVIGMRRSGKTWFLYQHMAELTSTGVPREAILYLNLEDERLLTLAARDLARIPDAFYRRTPQLKDRECHFLLDEVQAVPGWERFVRRLLDTERVRLVVTGSSSRLLGREIATSLRGRSLTTEVFPFSFAETMRHAGLDVPGRRPGGRGRAVIENAFQKYLYHGGFPEVQGLTQEHRARVLQGYLDVVILRDVVERHGVTSVTALRALIRHVVNAPATPLSVHRFHNDLRSRGVACGKNTLYELMQHLEDAYLLFEVPIRSRSERVRAVNPRKVYLIDTGLVVACRRPVAEDEGRLLENLVFLDLRRRGFDLSYHRTASGREVDFVVASRDGPTRLVQVCADLTDPDTRRREVLALEEAMSETGAEHATLVTLNEEGVLPCAGGRIRLVPAWMWLLDLAGD